MTHEKLESAREWLEDGHVLAKIHGITKPGNCTCGRNCGSRAGKHPVFKDPHGEHAIRTMEDAEAAFSSGLYNVGLVTGSPTGVVVLDVDTDDGKQGQESLEALAAVHGWDDLTSTRQHRTGGGGVQYLYRYQGPALKTSLSVIGRDLDFKAGDGGAFIVLPPSRSKKGLYEVLSDDPIQEAPSWLLGLCERLTDPTGRTGTVTVPSGPSAAAGGGFMAAPDADTAQRWDFYAEWVIRSARDNLRALQAAPTGWTMGIFREACTIFEIANSPWNTVGQREAERLIRQVLPKVTDGSAFDPWEVVEQARRRTAGKGRPAP